MAKVRVDLNCVPVDGQAVAFKAPCDCTAVDGILCYYAQGDEKVSKAFVFKDAHGNNVAGIGNLFAAGSVVKVVLDVTNGGAYLQNADTNAYLESRFNSMKNIYYGTGEPSADLGKDGDLYFQYEEE